MSTACMMNAMGEQRWANEDEDTRRADMHTRTMMRLDLTAHDLLTTVLPPAGFSPLVVGSRANAEIMIDRRGLQV